jgi:hypothetical protein
MPHPRSYTSVRYDINAKKQDRSLSEGLVYRRWGIRRFCCWGRCEWALVSSRVGTRYYFRHYGLAQSAWPPYWIAAGWAAHPLWDFPLHYLGPGHSFAPESWAIACVSFDLVVAVYIVIV